MNFKNLKPNDSLTVYHGTSLSNSYSLLNGFDATKIEYRDYGGPRHKGIFVTPDFKTALRFASYGPVVLELVVRAKNLHGTDWSGVTGREDPRREEIWRDKYPNSFRPYLSNSLESVGEPQALLKGLVSPRQIKRVWYAPSANTQGQWYTRKDFLKLGLETVPRGGYGSKKELKNFGVDVSYPNYSYGDFIEAVSRLVGLSKKRVEKTLSRRLKISLMPDRSDTLSEFFERVGFEPKASKRYADRIRAHFEATGSIGYKLPFIKRRLSKMARKIKTLPQGQWVDVTWNSLAKLVKSSVWELYDLTYAKIGKHIPNLATFGRNYKFLYLVDLDEDIKPDVFIAYKKTPAGKKVSLGGTDGSRKAKRALISKMKDLLRKGGWYMEASHKVADILESSGFNPIDNELVVRETLRGNPIEWLGNGKYSRQIGSSDITAVKSLYGNPKVGSVRQASENVPTNPKLWAKVQKLTKGEVKSIKVDGKEIVGPNDGKGFKIFPSAYGNGWASRIYKQLGGGWKKVKKASILNKLSAKRVVSRWVEGASGYYKRNPWELTLEEFLNPYPKPKVGYTSLYHYTLPSHVKGIIRSGLKTPFAHQNPKFTSMTDKPLIHFQAPSDQVRRESGGRTVVPMQSDVAAKDILSVHLKTWPDPSFMLFGNLRPEYRSDAGKWYGKELHQSYVEVALLTGQDVPQNVLKSYPKLKNRPHEPSSYELWYSIYPNTVDELLGSSESESRRAASLYFAASDPLSRIRSLIYDDPSVERDREILEIREDNPSFRRVIDDYLRGRFNPKYKATVYERVRSYDYPEDPTTDVLMEDEEYDSLDELLDDVQSYGWSEWSSSHPTSRDWVISHPEENWRDGGTTEYTLFIRRSDKNPLSKDDIRYISKELRLR